MSAFLHNVCMKHFFHPKKKWATFDLKKKFIVLDVRYQTLLTDLDSTSILSTDFRKTLKFQIS